MAEEPRHMLCDVPTNHERRLRWGRERTQQLIVDNDGGVAPPLVWLSVVAVVNSSSLLLLLLLLPPPPPALLPARSCCCSKVRSGRGCVGQMCGPQRSSARDIDDLAPPTGTRTPGPRRQNGPDPGTPAPNWPGPRTPDPGPDPGLRGVSGRLGAFTTSARVLCLGFFLCSTRLSNFFFTQNPSKIKIS